MPKAKPEPVIVKNFKLENTKVIDKKKPTVRFRAVEGLLYADYIPVDNSSPITVVARLKPGYNIDIEKRALLNDIKQKLAIQKEITNTKVRLMTDKSLPKQKSSTKLQEHKFKSAQSEEDNLSPTQKKTRKHQRVKKPATDTLESTTEGLFDTDKKAQYNVASMKRLKEDFESNSNDIVVSIVNFNASNYKDYEKVYTKHTAIECIEKDNTYNVTSLLTGKSVLCSSELMSARVAFCNELQIQGRLSRKTDRRTLTKLQRII